MHTAAYFNYQRQTYSVLFTIKCFRVKMQTHLHNMLDKRKFYVEIYIYIFWSDWQKGYTVFLCCWCWITNPHFEFCDLLMAGKFCIDLNRLIVCHCHLLMRAPSTITQLMNILSFKHDGMNKSIHCIYIFTTHSITWRKHDINLLCPYETSFACDVIEKIMDFRLWAVDFSFHFNVKNFTHIHNHQPRIII